MKNKTINKLRYLEEELRLDMSIIEEDESLMDSKLESNINNIEVHEITGIRKILFYVPLLCIFIVQFPFLLIPNLISLYYSLKNGIPIKVIPIVLPAKRVDLINNTIKIEMRFKEHPPPHFHIIIDKEDFSMDILSGRYLHNEIKNVKHRKAVAKWYKENKGLLIKTWNETRPTDCTVGKIVE